MENRLIIYVSSPDSYSDVFRVFLTCFKKNWNNCPYDLCLSTNTKKYDDIIVFNNYKEDDGWVDRTIDALNKINNKYILLMCDDLFIMEKPDEEGIEKILNYMDDNNINFCSLNGKIRGKKINRYLKKVRKNTPYAINLQIGIFNRLYLLSELGNGNLNAWQIEDKWLREASLSKRLFHEDVIASSYRLIKYEHAIIKGKWVPSAYKKTKKKLNESIDSNRIFMSRREVFVVEIKNIMTHLFPSKLRIFIKKFLIKIGFDFSAQN